MIKQFKIEYRSPPFLQKGSFPKYFKDLNSTVKKYYFYMVEAINVIFANDEEILNQFDADLTAFFDMELEHKHFRIPDDESQYLKAKLTLSNPNAFRFLSIDGLWGEGKTTFLKRYFSAFRKENALDTSKLDENDNFARQAPLEFDYLYRKIYAERLPDGHNLIKSLAIFAYVCQYIKYTYVLINNSSSDFNSTMLNLTSVPFIFHRYFSHNFFDFVNYDEFEPTIPIYYEFFTGMAHALEYFWQNVYSKECDWKNRTISNLGVNYPEGTFADDKCYEYTYTLTSIFYAFDSDKIPWPIKHHRTMEQELYPNKDILSTYYMFYKAYIKALLLHIHNKYNDVFEPGLRYLIPTLNLKRVIEQYCGQNFMVSSNCELILGRSTDLIMDDGKGCVVIARESGTWDGVCIVRTLSPQG